MSPAKKPLGVGTAESVLEQGRGVEEGGGVTDREVLDPGVELVFLGH
jgi:hypothetical protein